MGQVPERGAAYEGKRVSDSNLDLQSNSGYRISTDRGHATRYRSRRGAARAAFGHPHPHPTPPSILHMPASALAGITELSRPRLTPHAQAAGSTGSPSSPRGAMLAPPMQVIRSTLGTESAASRSGLQGN
jgi:hypothetical protein